MDEIQRFLKFQTLRQWQIGLERHENSSGWCCIYVTELKDSHVHLKFFVGLEVFCRRIRNLENYYKCFQYMQILYFLFNSQFYSWFPFEMLCLRWYADAWSCYRVLVKNLRWLYLTSSGIMLSPHNKPSLFTQFLSTWYRIWRGFLPSLTLSNSATLLTICLGIKF